MQVRVLSAGPNFNHRHQEIAMKKRNQLGMNPSTASQRLARDLLYRYAVELHDLPCHHCNQRMTRETFSIEHIVPWLDSDDPVGLYFDLDNISFSHDSCNKAAARRPNRMGHNTSEWRREYNARYYREHKERWKYKPGRAAYMREYNRKKKASIAQAVRASGF